MKKNILITILFVLVGLLSFFILSSNETDENVKVAMPYVLTMTKSVQIPNQIEFADEIVDLNRYDFREKYDREINSFTYLHSSVLLFVKRANRYFPIIEPILKKNNIPDDFKYLAVIESSLDPRAVSPAKAAGLWQFLASSGKECGLTITPEVDERYHIEKSTEAACKYLQKAYKKYGDWASVALSYNGGQGRISGELEKQQADFGLDLWLVEETTRYYFRMLAIKQVLEDPAKFGFVLSADQLYKPLSYKEVEISTTIPDLAEYAKSQGITYAQLKDFNSWLRDRKLTITTKPYTLKIPQMDSMNYNKGKTKVHNNKWIAAQ